MSKRYTNLLFSKMAAQVFLNMQKDNKIALLEDLIHKLIYLKQVKIKSKVNILENRRWQIKNVGLYFTIFFLCIYVFVRNFLVVFLL